MIIVGLTGSIGSGKTTLAGYLAGQTNRSTQWESWLVISEVATALRAQDLASPPPTDLAAINHWLRVLPNVLKQVVGQTADYENLKLTEERLRAHPENYEKLLEYLQLMQAHPNWQETAITPKTKEQFRSLLQWLGGYLVKTVSPIIWYGEIVRRIKNQPGIDLATVSGVRFPTDAECIKDAGGYIVQLERPSLTGRDQADLTERERSQIKADTIVTNSDGLEQLAACAAQIWKDLKAGRLNARYDTAEFSRLA